MVNSGWSGRRRVRYREKGSVRVSGNRGKRCGRDAVDAVSIVVAFGEER